MQNKDLTTTLAGGGAGLCLLLQVRWDAIPYGECVKVSIAVLFTLVGYLMYRGEQKQ